VLRKRLRNDTEPLVRGDIWRSGRSNDSHITSIGLIGSIVMKLAIVVLLLSLAFPVTVVADGIWDSCPRGEEYCEDPGDCSRYVDTNSDGICDLSQPNPSATTASQLDSQIQANIAIVDTNPVNSIITSGNNRIYHMVPIFVILSILYLLSHTLSKRRAISIATHRKIWNLLLLGTFLVSVILGLFLILRIDFDINISLPFDILLWHVEIGIAMGVICIFHIIWHWKYFKKMVTLKNP
jgi:hypothetical protein